MIFRVELPLPPSLNNAYVNRSKGRYLSQEAKDWKEEAGWDLILKRRGGFRFEGKYRFTIYLPQRMRGDASNRIKLAEDLLVSHGVTPDDRHCVEAKAVRSTDVPKDRCIVEVESA